MSDTDGVAGPAAAASSVLAGKAWYIPSLLSDVECEALIAAARDKTELVLKHYQANEDSSGRLCLRKVIQDEGLAGRLWRRIAALLPTELNGWELGGVCDSFRLIRYDPGHYYGAHVDMSNGLGRDGAHERRTFVTLMVYLNDGFDGGDLVFHTAPTEYRVRPETGLGFLFWQDDQALLHEGAPVTEGEKFILRGDVFYSRRTELDPPESSDDGIDWDEAERLLGGTDGDDSDPDFA